MNLTIGNRDLRLSVQAGALTITDCDRLRTAVVPAAWEAGETDPERQTLVAFRHFMINARYHGGLYRHARYLGLSTDDMDRGIEMINDHLALAPMGGFK